MTNNRERASRFYYSFDYIWGKCDSECFTPWEIDLEVSKKLELAKNKGVNIILLRDCEMVLFYSKLDINDCLCWSCNNYINMIFECAMVVWIHLLHCSILKHNRKKWWGIKGFLNKICRKLHIKRELRYVRTVSNFITIEILVQ